jgi:hypothetical protein
MKRQILMVLMIAVSFIALCSGCGSGNQSSAKSSNVTPKELEMYYPGDIMKVDSIEIFDGSNGKRKTITDQVRIREWIEKVRHNSNSSVTSVFFVRISLVNPPHVHLTRWVFHIMIITT